MASLAEGQKYGLSSHDKKLNNKTIIFVKLTDSALKSIEEYVNAKSSYLKPTIQFQSNNGVIRLPNNDSHYKSYGFNLSNVDNDGPQGSFECLRQEGTNSLESLGCMLLKMHINANEESYEKTRVKMAAVEKENKKNWLAHDSNANVSCPLCQAEFSFTKRGVDLETSHWNRGLTWHEVLHIFRMRTIHCKHSTKEIKPSSPYVGVRKVKLKRPMSSIPPRPSISPLHIPQASKLPIKPYANSVSMSANQFSPSVSSVRHVNGNNRINKRVSEVKKQSCRSRIIHLLALRPYKKPELLSKLANDGINEKEKISITAILTQVAVLGKDHSFSLAKHAWHDIQDDWKYYSQEETELVKSKKYQILNPGNESGTSSPATLPNQSPNQKRTLLEWETNYDQRNKKQRISRLNGVNSVSSNNLVSSTSARIESNHVMNGGRSSASSHNVKDEVNGHIKINGHVDEYHSLKSESRNHSKMNGVLSQPKPTTPEAEKFQHRQTSHHLFKQETPIQNDKSYRLNSNSKNFIRDSSSNPRNMFLHNESKRNTTSRSLSPVEKTTSNDSERQSTSHFGRTNGNLPQPLESHPKSYHNNVPRSNVSIVQEAISSTESDAKPYTNGYHCNGQLSDHGVSTGDSKNFQTTKEIPTQELDDSDGNCIYSDDDDSNSQTFESDLPPEYLKQYTRITSSEQRRKYKDDFNSDYEEYKKLHTHVMTVANKFVALENRLKCSVNVETYSSVQNEILSEYNKYRKPWYFESKKKLNFLHDKLSHIKRLVLEYDQSCTSLS